MITFTQVKKNPLVRAYISRTEDYMKYIGFTDHGFGHAEVVAERAGYLAKACGLPTREQELARIAGYCHDMGNFMGRTQHHYWGAVLFGQALQSKMNPNELTAVMQAIANHDKEDITIPSKITACVVIADKSDVRRSRVFDHSRANLGKDIHDRVNHAVTGNELTVEFKKKIINLTIKIDTKRSAIEEYFEIFAERMAYCRHSAEVLEYKFGIVVNSVKLL